MEEADLHGEILRDAGRAVIVAFHKLFSSDEMDNDEYTRNLRTAIEGIVGLAKERGGEAFGVRLADEFQDFSRQLFVEYWMKLAEEEGAPLNSKAERKQAQKTFDQSYVRAGHGLEP
jgi:hypothetical protein